MGKLRYEEAAEQLLARHLQVLDGHQLPTELQLAAELAVSRRTVRRALADLAAAGQVVRRPDAGTFALQSPQDHPDDHPHDEVARGARFGALAHIAQIRALEGGVAVTEDLLHAEIVPAPDILRPFFSPPRSTASSSSAAPRSTKTQAAPADPATSRDSGVGGVDVVSVVASTRAVRVGGRVLGILDAHTEVAAARRTAREGEEFGQPIPDDAVFQVTVTRAGPRRAPLLGIPATAAVLTSRRIASQRRRVIEVSTLAMTADLGEFVVRTDTRRHSRDDLLMAVRRIGPGLHG